MGCGGSLVGTNPPLCGGKRKDPKLEAVLLVSTEHGRMENVHTHLSPPPMELSLRGWRWGRGGTGLEPTCMRITKTNLQKSNSHAVYNLHISEKQTANSTLTAHIASFGLCSSLVICRVLDKGHAALCITYISRPISTHSDINPEPLYIRSSIT